MSNCLAWVVPALLVGQLVTGGCGSGSTAITDPDSSLPDAELSCADIACENGTCTITGGLPTCACDPGFKGDACDALDAPNPSAVLFWLDAADAATIESDGEARVTSWRDKGPAEIESHAPEADEEKPTLVLEGMNGRPVVRFDESASQTMDWQEVSAFGDATAYTMFMVFLVSGPGHAILHGSGFGNSIDLWTKSTGENPLAYRHNPSGDDASEVESSFGWTTGVPHLLTIRRSQTDMSIWVDGKHRVDIPVANTTNMDANLTLSIGPGAAAYFHGDVAELLVMEDALDLAARVKVEAYLGAKWFGAAPESDLTTFASASLWFDATESSSLLHADGVVGMWNNLGHAGGIFSQNLDEESRPRIVSAGLNGRDAVRFDGDDFLWLNNVEWTSKNAYEAYAVLVPAASGGSLTAFAALDGGDPGIRLNVLADAELIEFVHRWPASAAGGDIASLNHGELGAPILVELRRRPQTQSVRVEDASQIIAPEQAAIDAASLNFVLGAESATDPSYGFVGDIGELILVQSLTSEAERIALVQALREKWGL